MSDSTVKQIQDRIQYSEYVGPTVFALIVGLLAGMGAIVFRYLIQAAHWLFFDYGGQLSANVGFLSLGKSYIILVPAVGMLLVSLIVRRWAIEAQGHGVPEVQYAVKKEGGRIRFRVSVVKALASAICIGSGGSVGREGPIVQIGCSLGSNIGKVGGFREPEIKILLACGAAGAIAGTFNAPIAGVMFALEVILGSFAARSFGLVVISSVTSIALCHAFLGKQPAFELVQPFTLNSSWEFPLYLVLGLFVGMISLGYVKSVYFFERLFDSWRFNVHIKALLGGLAIGLLGFFGSEHIFGVGYEAIEIALQNNFGLQLLLLLLVLKMLATSITLGAGGSGGVFAPALFIGAMAGGIFGITVNYLFPSITASPGAYVLVGMAALFAGAAHAPITSIIILFEMTDNYKIILPLMLSAVVSYLVSSRLSRDSIYAIKLRRKGGLTPPKPEVSFLDMILVTDAMSMDYRTVSPELPITELAKLFQENLIRSCPVLNADDRLVGIVTEFDLKRAILGGETEKHTVSDIMTTNLITCNTDESLRVVLHRFTGKDVHQIPVVGKSNPEKLLGVLRRGEIFFAYNELVDEHQRLLNKAGVELRTSYEHSVQIKVQVRPEHEKICFKKIRDIGLPDQCLIAILSRGNSTVIPRGDIVIEPGDVLVLLTTRSHEYQLRNWIAYLGNETS